VTCVTWVWHVTCDMWHATCDMCGDVWICVIVWLCDCVIVWLCDDVIVWWCDCVMMWLCDDMIFSQNQLSNIFSKLYFPNIILWCFLMFHFYFAEQILSKCLQKEFIRPTEISVSRVPRHTTLSFYDYLPPLYPLPHSSHDITWHHITSYDIIWHHMTSHDIIWHHMTSYDITWHHMTSYDIIHMTSKDIIWHLMTSHRDMTWHDITTLHLSSRLVCLFTFFGSAYSKIADLEDWAVSNKRWDIFGCHLCDFFKIYICIFLNNSFSFPAHLSLFLLPFRTRHHRSDVRCPWGPQEDYTETLMVKEDVWRHTYSFFLFIFPFLFIVIIFIIFFFSHLHFPFLFFFFISFFLLFIN